MSKRKILQRNVADFFAPKRKPGDETDNEDDDSGDNESEFSTSNNPIPSNSNHNVQITLKMERAGCANGNGLCLDFVLHLSGTSSNQSNTERGDRELALDSLLISNMRVHIEGTAHKDVEVNVRVGGNREHNINANK